MQYLRQTMSPSKTLKPSLTYSTKPKAANLSNISTVKMVEKTRLLISTTRVKVSGWSWYSIPMLKVLMKMQRRMPCWKMLWSTQNERQALQWEKQADTAPQQAARQRNIGFF